MPPKKKTIWTRECKRCSRTFNAFSKRGFVCEDCKERIIKERVAKLNVRIFNKKRKKVICNKCNQVIKCQVAYINCKSYCDYCYGQEKNGRGRTSIARWYLKYLENQKILKGGRLK